MGNWIRGASAKKQSAAIPCSSAFCTDPMTTTPGWEQRGGTYVHDVLGIQSSTLPKDFRNEAWLLYCRYVRSDDQEHTPSFEPWMEDIRRYYAVDFYDVLEISFFATQAEIKTKFKQLALRLHPDKGASQSNTSTNVCDMASINEAKQVLEQQSTRELYNRIWKVMHEATSNEKLANSRMIVASKKHEVTDNDENFRRSIDDAFTDFLTAKKTAADTLCASQVAEAENACAIFSSVAERVVGAMKESIRKTKEQTRVKHLLNVAVTMQPSKNRLDKLNAALCEALEVNLGDIEEKVSAQSAQKEEQTRSLVMQRLQSTLRSKLPISKQSDEEQIETIGKLLEDASRASLACWGESEIKEIEGRKKDIEERLQAREAVAHAEKEETAEAKMEALCLAISKAQSIAIPEQELDLASAAYSKLCQIQNDMETVMQSEPLSLPRLTEVHAAAKEQGFQDCSHLGLVCSALERRKECLSKPCLTELRAVRMTMAELNLKTAEFDELDQAIAHEERRERFEALKWDREQQDRKRKRCEEELQKKEEELLQQKLAALEVKKEALRQKEADLAEYRDIMDALDVNGCEGEIEKLQEDIAAEEANLLNQQPKPTQLAITAAAQKRPRVPRGSAGTIMDAPPPKALSDRDEPASRYTVNPPARAVNFPPEAFTWGTLKSGELVLVIHMEKLEKHLTILKDGIRLGQAVLEVYSRKHFQDKHIWADKNSTPTVPRETQLIHDPATGRVGAVGSNVENRIRAVGFGLAVHAAANGQWRDEAEPHVMAVAANMRETKPKESRRSLPKAPGKTGVGAAMVKNRLD